jgi:hypothetical protein
VTEKTRTSVLIRLEDHMLVDDLCTHYRRAGLTAHHVGGGLIAVFRQDAGPPEQDRWEVLAHLRLWEVANPDARGELL